MKFRWCAGMLVVLMVGMVAGCSLFKGKGTTMSRPGAETFDQLERAFRRGRYQDVTRLIYEQGEISKPDIRSEQQSVFLDRSGIRLEFTSLIYHRADEERIIREEGTRVLVDTRWQLNWEVAGGGQIQHCTGSTTFELVQEQDRWLISNQQGAQLLGSRNPGSCSTP